MGPTISRPFNPRKTESSPTSTKITTTTSPSPLKRKRSVDYEQDVLPTTTAMVYKGPPLTIAPELTYSPDESILEHADDVVDAGSAPPSPKKCPPSPVPTEPDDTVYIITQADHVANALSLGIKIWDFALLDDPEFRRGRAPEYWQSPVHTLTIHDMYIRASAERAFMYKLTGKLLWRLLQIGWVTQEEAERHWTQEDCDAVARYDEVSAYPFVIPRGVRKPSKSYRATLRIETYGEPRGDEVPEEEIYMPEDGPDVDNGPPTLVAPLPTNNASDESPHAKKRRVEKEAEVVSASIATPPTTPPPAQETTSTTADRSSPAPAPSPTSTKSPPTKSSPTKSSPTKSSPTKASPTKASPTKSSPSEDKDKASEAAPPVSRPISSRAATPPPEEEQERPRARATSARTIRRTRSLFVVR